MTSAISVKDRLKIQAVASGKTFQEALTAYGLERTVYRLSVSEYVERFTLKGGIFLYALFEGEFARATRDIDLLARNMPNNVEERRWKAFLKKKKALLSAELEDVVNLRKMLLLPIVESITGNNNCSAKWDHVSRSWKAIREKG